MLVRVRLTIDVLLYPISTKVLHRVKTSKAAAQSAPRSDSIGLGIGSKYLLKNPWAAMSIARLNLILGSGLYHPISLTLLCPSTLYIIWQCTGTSMPAWYTVRNKRLTVAPSRPISELSRPSCDHRCLYRNLCYLDLRPHVGCVFEGRTMHAYLR